MSYPNMLGYNRLVFDSTYTDYSCLLSVILSSNKNCKSPVPNIGEIPLQFLGTTELGSWADISIMFNEPAIHILEQTSIKCSTTDAVNILRGKELINNLIRIGSSVMPKFVHKGRPGDTGNSDSDDENVPLTPEMPILFSKSELVLIQDALEKVWVQYRRAISGEFSNGPGKFFIDNLSKYLGFATTTHSRFESSHSTSTGGKGAIGSKDTQAGSSLVTAVVRNSHRIRGVSSSNVCLSPIKRYSDVSTFDHVKRVYILSGELKSLTDSADFQNLEQMLGLWRLNQTFMLGCTVNPSYIHCRILTMQEPTGLWLYQLKCINSLGNIIHLAKLYIASILIVDTTN